MASNFFPQAQSTIFNADYATVEISVSDLNDNHPLFAKPRYDASVSESASIGTTLLRIVATDKDIVSTHLVTMIWK